MFQYTKENILNSCPAISVKDGKLIIPGYGEYVISNIVDNTVYKTVFKPGRAGVLTIPVADLIGEKELSFRVITPNQYLAEFASPNWEVFGKPIIVGMNAEDADDVLAAVELAIPQDNTFATVALDTNKTNLVITGKSKYISFDKCYIDDVNVTKERVTPNVEPFATKEWIIENLRFPTYPNIRYASASTMPTADAYTEFAFTYKAPRVGLGGLSGVGQAIDAVTRHIFYVAEGTAADTFATKLGAGTGNAGLTVDGTPSTGADKSEVLEDYE